MRASRCSHSTVSYGWRPGLGEVPADPDADLLRRHRHGSVSPPCRSGSSPVSSGRPAPPESCPRVVPGTRRAPTAERTRPQDVVVRPPGDARCGVNYNTEIPRVSTANFRAHRQHRPQADRRGTRASAGGARRLGRSSCGARRPPARSRRRRRSPCRPRRSAGTRPSSSIRRRSSTARPSSSVGTSGPAARASSSISATAASTAAGVDRRGPRSPCGCRRRASRARTAP